MSKIDKSYTFHIISRGDSFQANMLLEGTDCAYDELEQMLIQGNRKIPFPFGSVLIFNSKGELLRFTE